MGQQRERAWSEPASPRAADADDATQALAAQQDTTAFVTLYERYVDRIYRYCRLRLGATDRAEDATSEIFLRALERIDGYRGGSFAAWIFAIARNVVVDHYRHAGPALPEPSLHLPDRGRTPEGWAVISAQREAVRQALDALSDEQRASVELALAGWRGAEIAEALGRSEAAVKMLRLRAVRRLRELMLEAGWDEGEYLDD